MHHQDQISPLYFHKILAFLVTPSTFSKLIFSTSEHSTISKIEVNFTQTAQVVSSITSGELSVQKSEIIFDINLLMVDLVEIWHFFWTSNTYVLIFYQMHDIQVTNYTQHIFPYNFHTRFFDAGKLKPLHVVWILLQNLHIGIYAL